MEQARVAQAISGVAGVESWHKLRTRGAGRHVFVDVHIQVAPGLSVERAHAIASQVERAISEARSRPPCTWSRWLRGETAVG